MKKLISLTLCLFFILSLTACGRAMDDAKSDVESAGDAIVSGTESVADRVESGMQSDANSSNTQSGKKELMAKISADEAKAAALAHAKLDEENVSDVDIDLDRDNGVLIYEVDFNANGTEYDYDINAETGEVISADKDRE